MEFVYLMMKKDKVLINCKGPFKQYETLFAQFYTKLNFTPKKVLKKSYVLYNENCHVTPRGGYGTMSPNETWGRKGA
jgi:hypothetical protein